MTFSMKTISPSFWATVRGQLHGEDGKRLTFAVEMKFKRLTKPELEAFTAKMTAEKLGDEAFVHHIVEDWRDVTDENDEPKPFSRDGLQWFIDNGLGRSIVDAFTDSTPTSRTR